MRLLAKALVLSMCCSAASACEEKRVVTHLSTPAERLVCDPAGDRPTVPPEYRIDWAKVRSVAEAKAEHEKFVATLRTREGAIAAYILKLEGNLFVCWNNMEWRRQYEAEIGG